jgi:Pyridoxamine 5'-phosphate oxidase
VRLSDAEALARAEGADHGVLCTVHARRGVDAVPACFVIDGDVVAVPIDAVKPKTSASLQRTRNLARDARAALLVERWDPTNWSRLWWVRLSLVQDDEPQAAVDRLAARLRQKYEQYAEASFEAILTFRVTEVAGWSAAAEPASDAGPG